MTPIRTGNATAPAAKHAAAIVQIETLDGNGPSLSFPNREAAEIAFRRGRTGSNVQHRAPLTHLRDGCTPAAPRGEENRSRVRSLGEGATSPRHLCPARRVP